MADLNFKDLNVKDVTEDKKHKKGASDNGGSDNEDVKLETGFDDNDVMFLYLGDDDPRLTTRREFAKLVCTSNLPPRSVKCPHFLKFVHQVNRTAKLGDMKSLKEDCLQIYEEEKVKIKQLLKILDGKINLTAEMLMCPRFDRYICLTAHFIDEEWNLKKWVLKYHNDDISFIGRLQKALVDWDIEDKIFTVSFKTITYSDYLDEFLDSVRAQIQKKKTLELNGQLFHVSCCAELFRMMAEVAFNEISNIIDKAKEVMWSKSEYMWHLTLSKLKNALEYRLTDEFTSEDWTVHGFHNFPSADEWNKLECVCKLVEAVDDVAKLLFFTTNPSACLFLGSLLELKANLAKKSSSLDTFAQNVSEKMIKKLDDYLNDMFLVLAVATVMDPRCKMQYIEYISAKFEGSGSDSKVSTVMEAIRSLYNVYAMHEIPKKDARSFSGSPLKNELDLYLEGSVLPWSQDYDILKWWKVVGCLYPNVSRMARDLLSIPFTVVTSDDGYYEEERMIDRDLRGIGQDFMDALKCSRSWTSKFKEFSIFHPFITPYIYRISGGFTDA